MDSYHFNAVVRDPSVYEYPTNVTFVAESLKDALAQLEQEYGLTVDEVDRRTVVCVTRDDAVVEYEVS